MYRSDLPLYFPLNLVHLPRLCIPGVLRTTVRMHFAFVPRLRFIVRKDLVLEYFQRGPAEEEGVDVNYSRLSLEAAPTWSVDDPHAIHRSRQSLERHCVTKRSICT